MERTKKPLPKKMIRTHEPLTKEQNSLIRSYSELVARVDLMTRLGKSYDGDRDLYQALGYPQELNYVDYTSQYSRQDMAKAVIDRPVKVTWSGPVSILEPDDKEETELETGWRTLVQDLKLKPTFIRLDKLTGLGRYGVLLLGLNDVSKLADFAKPVKPSESLKLLYTRPLGEGSATISKFVENVSDPRYGLPFTYDIKITEPNGRMDTLVVHHSRVIHVVENTLESEIIGIPRLQSVFNRLKDLEKLSGGSAEMFWRGARPGFSGDVDPEYTLGAPEEAALQDQMDEYEHNLRRLFVNEGVKLRALEVQISDPSGHVKVQVQLISADTGIPNRILSGSERGELSSAQDSQEWISYVQSRREEFVEPQIIRPFVQRMIDFKILKAPKKEFEIEWRDLFAVSEKDKVEIGKSRAFALREYTQNLIGPEVVPPEAFFEFFLGLSREQIEVIKDMTGDNILESVLEGIRLEQQTQPQPQPSLNAIEN